MNVAPEIFKAYDIRGIYGKNLNEEIADAIARAFTVVVKAKTVVVGRDARISSPSLHKTVLSALSDVGVNVIDLGTVSTDMYYYACATKNMSGIMITASHNPKEYNGFKMVRQIPYLLSGDEGIQDIRRLIENDELPPASPTKGTVEHWDIMDEFVDKMLSLVDTKRFKPMKVLADTANGMVGPSLTKLFQKLPQLELVPMYFEPDGNFPNHGGDPLQEENRIELQERVVSERADLGFAFDPDGDRFFVVDSKGRFVSGDFITTILARYFLQNEPGSVIVYDIRSSKAVKDNVEALGGKALHNRVGHAYIKKRMMDENGIFGGEVTGHYYFRDFYYCDSGIAPMLYLLDLLSQADKTLDVMLDELAAKYYLSGEINTTGVDSKAVVEKIEAYYAKQAQNIQKVDGLSMDFGDWRFNIRASNTEPLVRLNLEADTESLMEAKRDEVLAMIRA